MPQTRKICFVGAESVGKSTMVSELASIYCCQYTVEAGREYVEAKGPHDDGIWQYILDNQIREEVYLLQQAFHFEQFLFCDTDLITTLVWYEAWVGKQDDMWHEIARKAFQHCQTYDLYIFLWNNVPWVQDGTRTEEKRRGWFNQRLFSYFDAAQKLGLLEVKYVMSRNYKDRLRYVEQVLDSIEG